VLSAAFSDDPEGSRVITGSEDNSARIWETATGKLLHTLEGHTAAVSSVAFLPNTQPGKAGNRVITGSLDNSAKLWDSVTGQEILTLKGHSQEVTCVNAAPSGRYLVTGSRDGTALLWPAIDWLKPAAGAGEEKALSAKK
jgi:WD40 repeat protein